ncbi:hypothetical protein WMF18_23430 [Sorangium sp. So ce315]|uniref:Vgb family protein n=1 Tax=Sorangium sp. So ce315 TaxID=3133299 RepID=UPI003F5E7426
MKARDLWALAIALTLPACSGDGSGETGGGAGQCAAGGTGTLALDIESAVPADVRVSDAAGVVEGGTAAESRTLALPAGEYRVSAHRVRSAGEIVGPAYQGAIEGEHTVCVRDGETTTVAVRYTREPGSEKLWVTNTNGEGQILAFDAEQLAAGGEQTPSVVLDAGLTSPTALRVDGAGRLWIGDRAGKLAVYDAARLGASSGDAPDAGLGGPGLCETSSPCGPGAMAFDAEGALWVATLSRIVRIRLDALGALEGALEPEPEISLTSPDASRPVSLAFDAEGNLWVGDGATNGVVKFEAERLRASIVDEPADVVLLGQSGPPVVANLRGPQGLAFDADGNLWVGYFSGNQLVRYTPEERAASGTLTPEVLFDIDVLALVTDLAVDESGNLWMPGSAGSVYRIDAEELTSEEPALVALTSDAIGSAVKLTLNTVAGPTYIAP